MENDFFAPRVEIGRLHVFACSIHVTFDMNGACQTYEDWKFQLRGAFRTTIMSAPGYTMR